MEDSANAATPVLPIIIGMAFIIALSYSIGHFSERQLPGSGKLLVFDAIEKNLPELKTFEEKFGNPSMTQYFGRSQNGTIEFIYVAMANIDKDGDGYNKTNHRLELSILYDESGHMLTDASSYDKARVKQMEIHCREQVATSIDVDKAYSDIIPPAYNRDVGSFIENTKCLT